LLKVVSIRAGVRRASRAILVPYVSAVFSKIRAVARASMAADLRLPATSVRSSRPKIGGAAFPEELRAPADDVRVLPVLAVMLAQGATQVAERVVRAGSIVVAAVAGGSRIRPAGPVAVAV
jgi:hypothetical protein